MALLPKKIKKNLVKVESQACVPADLQAKQKHQELLWTTYSLNASLLTELMYTACI